jgi:error-prone DNA polymerase
VTHASNDRLEGTVLGQAAPCLPGMEPLELTIADLWATGVSPESHPMEHARGGLPAEVVPVEALAGVPDRTRVMVAGVVTHRQQPQTAAGTIFLNLEDETGILNVICSPGVWTRYRRVARDSPALVIRGRLERADGVTSLVAEGFRTLFITTGNRSRDFR